MDKENTPVELTNYLVQGFRRSTKSRVQSRFKKSTHQLGKGTFGTVYLGVDQQTKKRVALKIDHSSRSQKSTQSEVRALRRACGLEDVIQFIDHYEEDGKSVIVTHVAPGCEVFDAVGSGVSEAEAREIFEPMLHAVTTLHKANITWRDIKLENCMWCSKTKKITLIDLGLSAVDTEIFDIAVGSVSYMGPEVIDCLCTGRPYRGVAADLWALGVCLFAMITGFFPAMRADVSSAPVVAMAAAQEQAMSGMHALFKLYGRSCKFSPELVQLLDQMLQINPDKRASGDDLKAAPWFKL